jgi:hypothetical protein
MVVCALPHIRSACAAVVKDTRGIAREIELAKLTVLIGKDVDNSSAHQPPVINSLHDDIALVTSTSKVVP